MNMQSLMAPRPDCAGWCDACRLERSHTVAFHIASLEAARDDARAVCDRIAFDLRCLELAARGAPAVGAVVGASARTNAAAAPASRTPPQPAVVEAPRVSVEARITTSPMEVF